MKHTTLTAAIIGLSLSGAAWAEKWDMPTPYGDANHPTQVARQFAEEVSANAGEALSIKVHSGGSLIKHQKSTERLNLDRYKLVKYLLVD